MKITDESCFSCGSKFDENDDVVVCPHCGTPYHRECYEQAGDCINTQLHESGEKYKRDESKINIDSVKVGTICPECGHRNDADAAICNQCGANLQIEDTQNTAPGGEGINVEDMFGGANPFFKPYLGFNPEEDLGGATVREVSDFVGSNTLYYLPLFKKMKDVGSKASINLACFLFPHFYFANRKMWFWGILTALVSIILEIPATLYTLASLDMSFAPIQDILTKIAENEDMLIAMNEACVMVSWIFRLVVCTFANWLYFRFAIKSIRKIKATSDTGNADTVKIKAAGGVNPPNMLYMLLIIMGITLAASALLLGVLTFM